MTLVGLILCVAASAYAAFAYVNAVLFTRDARATGMSWPRAIGAGVVVGLAWPVFFALAFIVGDA